MRILTELLIRKKRKRKHKMQAQIQMDLQKDLVKQVVDAMDERNKKKKGFFGKIFGGK